MMQDGLFREDLFYRLQVIPIHTPPLRERREDIPMLAEHFLRRFADQMGKRVVKVSDVAVAALMRYAWPGNVRELENVIERAVALETTEAVLPERLPDGIRSPARAAASARLGPGFELDRHLRSVEAQLLQQALEQSAGDRGHAATLLGVTPRQLRYLLQKHRPGADKSWPP